MLEASFVTVAQVNVGIISHTDQPRITTFIISTIIWACILRTRAFIVLLIKARFAVLHHVSDIGSRLGYLRNLIATRVLADGSILTNLVVGAPDKLH